MLVPEFKAPLLKSQVIDSFHSLSSASPKPHYLNLLTQSFYALPSAFLFRELTRKDLEIPRQVKFRLLVLWTPLFCHASNGHASPILTSFQKAEIERAMDEVISNFPAMEQEFILTTWLENYAVSVSDWPNLGLAYDRWCQSTREMVHP